MQQIADFLDNFLKWISAAALAGMMFLTCADVVMRGLGRPIPGAVELVGFLAVIAVAGAMPHTHTMRSHAAVDMLVRRFSERNRAIVDSITGCVSVALFVAVTWYMFEYGESMRNSGEVSMTLEFPTYLIVYCMAGAFGVLCLTLTAELMKSISKVIGK